MVMNWKKDDPLNIFLLGLALFDDTNELFRRAERLVKSLFLRWPAPEVEFFDWCVFCGQ
jgi:hypothetical protein